jgi:hypothetical protein
MPVSKLQLPTPLQSFWQGRSCAGPAACWPGSSGWAMKPWHQLPLVRAHSARVPRPLAAEGCSGEGAVERVRPRATQGPPSSHLVEAQQGGRAPVGQARANQTNATIILRGLTAADDPAARQHSRAAMAASRGRPRNHSIPLSMMYVTVEASFRRSRARARRKPLADGSLSHDQLAYNRSAGNGAACTRSVDRHAQRVDTRSRSDAPAFSGRAQAPILRGAPRHSSIKRQGNGRARNIGRQACGRIRPRVLEQN